MLVLSFLYRNFSLYRIRTRDETDLKTEGEKGFREAALTQLSTQYKNELSGDTTPVFFNPQHCLLVLPILVMVL